MFLFSFFHFFYSIQSGCDELNNTKIKRFVYLDHKSIGELNVENPTDQNGKGKINIAVKVNFYI